MALWGSRRIVDLEWGSGSEWWGLPARRCFGEMFFRSQ